ncbi:MAG: tetratricopeptide repeat protein, partial [Pseudobdellovibrionaceae bacterium]
PISEKKQFEKAVGYFEKLVKNEDYSTPFLAHYYIGRVRLEQGTEKSKKHGVAALQKTLELKPDFIDALMALGQHYQSEKQDAEAIKLYKSYQVERGSNPRVADSLAQLYLEADQYESAYEQLKIVETMGEDQVGAKVRMGLIQVELKNYELAISKFNEVLSIAPESDKIRFYLAAIYKEKKEFPEAIEHFKKVPVLSSHYGEAIVQAAYLQKLLKKNDDAIKTVTEGLQNRKDVPQMYALYGSLLEEKGELVAAETMLKDAVTRFPDNAQLHFFMGTLYDRLEKRNLVVEQMQKVIEIDPDHVQGLNYLAYTYAEGNGDLDHAEQLARKAAKIDPADGYILDTLGWVLFKKGKFSDAVKTLEKAHEIQPNESIIAEHLGDAYYKTQLVDKARLMYKKAATFESDTIKRKKIEDKLAALEKTDAPIFHSRQPAQVTPGHE